MRNLFVRGQNLLSNLKSDENGASAVEYGLLVALIAAVIVGVVGTLGGQIQHRVQDRLDRSSESCFSTVAAPQALAAVGFQELVP